MNNSEIKKKYSDVLYWVTSPMSKTEDYHLTRTQEAILRKLIHYDKKNPKITYSNKIIGQHTFLTERKVQDLIPVLNKLGFISSATTRIKDDGVWYSRRTIYIKWDFIEELLSTIPTLEEEEETKIDDTPTSEDMSKTKEEKDIQPETIEPAVEEIIDEVNNNAWLDDFNSTDEPQYVDEYSTIIFKLKNGVTVKVLDKHLDYWNAIQHKKSLLKTIGTNTNQFQFDYDLDNRCELIA